MTTRLLGLRTVIYPAPNLAESKAYWGVANVQEALDEAVAIGGVEYAPATEVGDGITTGTVRLPDGSLVGFIENPHFKLG